MDWTEDLVAIQLFKQPCEHCSHIQGIHRVLSTSSQCLDHYQSSPCPCPGFEPKNDWKGILKELRKKA